MPKGTYQIGVGRADITPPVGIRLCGYSVREGLSTAVESPLSTTALLIQAEKSCLCILAIDLTIISVSLAATIREACAASLGAPKESILLNVNHTHCAPTLPDFQPYEEEPQAKVQREYVEYLTAQCVAASQEAWRSRRVGRLAVSEGECLANVNRREFLPDGTVLIGENFSAPTDSSVGVLRADQLDGTPLAVAFRFSCHPITLGPRTNVISPDFPGYARRVVETEMSCLSLFLQGCAGNQNPITGIGSDADSNEDTRRIGSMVGGEVLKTAAMIRTHRRRSEPTLMPSVAPYWLYEYEAIPSGGNGQVQVREIEMTLELTPFPELAELEAEAAMARDNLRSARDRGAGERELNVLTRFDFWARKRLAAAEAGHDSLVMRFPVQVAAVEDLALVALPFEVLAETGFAIRDASPFPTTLVLGYSNGVITYLPTPQVSLEGGMEARLGYKNYLLPSAIPGDWEPEVVRTALRLLHDLSERSGSITP